MARSTLHVQEGWRNLTLRMFAVIEPEIERGQDSENYNGDFEQEPIQAGVGEGKGFDEAGDLLLDLGGVPGQGILRGFKHVIHLGNQLVILQDPHLQPADLVLAVNIYSDQDCQADPERDQDQGQGSGHAITFHPLSTVEKQSGADGFLCQALWQSEKRKLILPQKRLSCL
jgi:hypothetical protein